MGGIFPQHTPERYGIGGTEKSPGLFCSFYVSPDRCGSVAEQPVLYAFGDRKK